MSLLNLRRIKIYLLYLFAFCSILCCNTVYSSFWVKLMWQLILVAMFIVSVNEISKSNKSMKNIFNVLIFSSFFSIAVIMFFFFNYLQSPSNITNYVFLLFVDPLLLFTFFVSQLNYKSYNKLFYIFENIVVMLSIISLVFWVLAMIGFPSNTSKVINWGGVKTIPGYFDLDYIAQGRVNFLGVNNIVRNTGIFTEAPMYNYVLCIAFLIEIFFKKQICKWKLIILIITIISTTSTTGLLIIIPSILYKLFFLSKNNLYRILIILIIPFIFIIFKFILSNKVGDINNNLSSYNMRKNDIISCIYAWEQHIFIGNGINNTAPISNYGYVLYINGLPTQSAGGSNGIFMVLALGGIIYSLFYIIPTILFALKSHKTLAIAVFTFILLINTVIYNSFICIILLSYFWAYSLCKSNNRSLLLPKL